MNGKKMKNKMILCTHKGHRQCSIYTNGKFAANKIRCHSSIDCDPNIIESTVDRINSISNLFHKGCIRWIRIFFEKALDWVYTAVVTCSIQITNEGIRKVGQSIINVFNEGIYDKKKQAWLVLVWESVWQSPAWLRQQLVIRGTIWEP